MLEQPAGSLARTVLRDPSLEGTSIEDDPELKIEDILQIRRPQEEEVLKQNLGSDYRSPPSASIHASDETLSEVSAWARTLARNGLRREVKQVT